MATWGSTPCHLDDDVDDEEEYNLETGVDEEDEQEECAESSSDEDVHIYASSRNQCLYSNRKNQGRSVLNLFCVVSQNPGFASNISLCPQQPEASSSLLRRD